MGEPIKTVGELAGICGYDGSVWRKSNLLLGYNAVYHDRVVETSASAGENNLYGEAVPENEIWIITAMSAWNNTRSIDVVTVGIVTDISTQWVDNVLSPAAQELAKFSGHLILAEGHKAWGYYSSCTEGDLLVLEIFGYKMALDL